MVQQLALVAFPDDLDSVPSTHMAAHKLSVNPSFRGSDALFWPPRKQALTWCTLNAYFTTDPVINSLSLY